MLDQKTSIPVTLITLLYLMFFLALSREERVQRDYEQRGGKRRKSEEEVTAQERKELNKALNSEGK